MFDGVKELIESSSSIYIVAHENPDGDAIGCVYSLYLGLKQLGKNAKVLMKKRSDIFDFLPHIHESTSCIDESEYDLLICADSSDKNRLDIKEDDFKKAKKVLMVDHHKIVNPYGDVNCIDDKLPAACELVYSLLVNIGVNITQEIAMYLYLGIMTDTGSFNYSSTRPSTLITTSKLIETGIDFSLICKKINDTMKEAKLKLVAIAIENMEVYFDGKVRFTYIDYDTIKKLCIDEEDAEGMVNYLRKVEGTEVAIYVRGKSDGTDKVSLRSNGLIDVSKVAISYGGGGHERAAGYTFNKDFATSKKELLEFIGGML